MAQMRPTPERLEECETGCMNFTGGEVKHHKDCVFYPESMSQQIDTLRGDYELIRGEGEYLERQRKQWRDECEKVRQERDQLKIDRQHWFEQFELICKENDQLTAEAEERENNNVDEQQVRELEYRLHVRTRDLCEALEAFERYCPEKYRELSDNVLGWHKNHKAFDLERKPK